MVEEQIFHHSTTTTEGSATGHTISSNGSVASSTFAPAYGMSSVYFPDGDSDYLYQNEYIGSDSNILAYYDTVLLYDNAKLF